jgi:hypothetical protein
MLLNQLRKPKISYFVNAIIDKNIGGFDIPMDDMFFRQIFESLIDVRSNGIELHFCQMPIFFEFFIKISTIA